MWCWWCLCLQLSTLSPSTRVQLVSTTVFDAAATVCALDDAVLSSNSAAARDLLSALSQEQSSALNDFCPGAMAHWTHWAHQQPALQGQMALIRVHRCSATAPRPLASSRSPRLHLSTFVALHPIPRVTWSHTSAHAHAPYGVTPTSTHSRPVFPRVVRNSCPTAEMFCVARRPGRCRGYGGPGRVGDVCHASGRHVSPLPAQQCARCASRCWRWGRVVRVCPVADAPLDARTGRDDVARR